MTCDCCRRQPPWYRALRIFPAIIACYECLSLAVDARIPLSAVADFIELCRDAEPGNL
jgi:hypothetical protein